MPCYNSASLPKAEIRAVFAFIVFELPGLTGISGFALPRGHHLKLPVERSQLRASSWRKQFSCITSSRNSACGSGSQEWQNQQGGTGQARRVPPFPWEQFSGVSWEQESWLWLMGREPPHPPEPQCCTQGWRLWEITFCFSSMILTYHLDTSCTARQTLLACASIFPVST